MRTSDARGVTKRPHLPPHPTRSRASWGRSGGAPGPFLSHPRRKVNGMERAPCGCLVFVPFDAENGPVPASRSGVLDAPCEHGHHWLVREHPGVVPADFGEPGSAYSFARAYSDGLA